MVLGTLPWRQLSKELNGGLSMFQFSRGPRLYTVANLGRYRFFSGAFIGGRSPDTFIDTGVANGDPATDVMFKEQIGDPRDPEALLTHEERLGDAMPQLFLLHLPVSVSWNHNSEQGRLSLKTQVPALEILSS